MKKIISMLLALLMTAAVFAGCSKEPEQDETQLNSEPEIVINNINESFTAVIYDRGEDEAFWKAAKAAFESANPGVTINMIVTKDAAYEVRDRILGGNSPDFVFLPLAEESSVTSALIKDKAMTALTDIEGAMPSGVFENSSCRPHDDGVTYIAPLFIEETGLIYNIETLAESGFSVPKSWDDFISIAEGCKNRDYEFFTYAGAEPDEFVGIFAAAIASEAGTEELGKILGCEKEAWENAAIKTFAENIGEIKSLVVSGSSTKTREDVKECLTEGDALFISGTAAELRELNKDGKKYAICAYPSIGSGQVKTVSFAEMYIPVEAKEAELAKSFISFLYGEDAKALMEEHLGIEPFGSGETLIAPEFSVKTAGNETLSDEFCELVVSIFKSKTDSEDFVEKMIEYIEEF